MAESHAKKMKTSKAFLPWGNGQDYSRRNSLAHVADGEPSELGELLELLHAEGLERRYLHHCGIPCLEELRVVLLHLARLGVERLLYLGYGAANLRGVHVEHRRITNRYRSRVREHDYLRREILRHRGRIAHVPNHVAAVDVLLLEAPHVEADVVSGNGLEQLLVVRLEGFYLAGLAGS